MPRSEPSRSSWFTRLESQPPDKAWANGSWPIAVLNMSTIFWLSSLSVLPLLGLDDLLPRWRWTVPILRLRIVIAATAALYAALTLPRLAEIWPVVSRPTLNGVAALLGLPVGATIAWVHFLAFDLFVGRWVYLDSQERRQRIRSGRVAKMLSIIAQQHCVSGVIFNKK
jgi:hypothetical protein